MLLPVPRRKLSLHTCIMFVLVLAARSPVLMFTLHSVKPFALGTAKTP